MADLDIVIRQPIGTIQMFSGLLVDIPTGWALCDGSGTTPNLIAKFVLGASAGQEPGSDGGEDEHTLTVAELPNHNHSTLATGGGRHAHTPSFTTLRRAPIANNRQGSSPSGSFQSGLNAARSGTWTIGTTGGAPHENRPAFFELAYIQRIT